MRNGSQSLARSKRATWPSACTPASVRPAPWTLTCSPEIASIAVLERLLHGRPVSLPLPAAERSAVIFEHELVARHER